MKTDFNSCPACGAAIRAHNDADPKIDLLEGWDFECGGGLYRASPRNVVVNFECKGTEPLKAAMQKLRRKSLAKNLVG